MTLTNIARVLTKRVHFAVFARVRIFDQKSRKSDAAKDYRCLSIGIPKMTFGVRIPVGRRGQRRKSGCDDRKLRNRIDQARQRYRKR